MAKILEKLRKFAAGLLIIALLAAQFSIPANASTLDLGTDTLANPTAGETSAHSIAFSTTSDLVAGDSIELTFPDFEMNFADVGDIIVPVGPTADISFSNADTKITLALTANFAAGAVEVAIADGALTNPTAEGEYLVRIATKNSAGEVLDLGAASAEIANEVRVSVNIIPIVLNVTSSIADGDYWIDDEISIAVEFSGNVFVAGTPRLVLNNDGVASYSSGSGTATLIFNYRIGADQETDASGELDYSGTNSLELAGGAIALTNGKSANLILASPGSTHSLGANKNLNVRGGGGSDRPTNPQLLRFEIFDKGGMTNEHFPILNFAMQNAEKVALSCDDGASWSAWIGAFGRSELNLDSDEFDILSCGAESGLKKISIKCANSFGAESTVLFDSTIYVAPPATIATAIPATPGEVGEPGSGEEKITEIGYFDPNFQFWRSFRDVVFDENGEPISDKNALEIREIIAKKLAEQSGNFTTTTPVFSQNGEVPVDVVLTDATNSAKVEIYAGTKITAGGEIYSGVFFAPELVGTPPPLVDENFEISNAFFLGSSAGSINFDQPIRVTLPTEQKIQPQMRYFDEEKQEWVATIDAKNGKLGGEISDDGAEISSWVDHATLFTVVGVKQVRLVGISNLELGSGGERRAEFESGEWFSPADIGNDDLVSFAWSGAGEKFYYQLDKNPEANSLRKITDATKFTTNFFLDGIRIAEGESYFHIRAEGADGERDGETVFVINYDKTPPRLAKIKTESNKIELHFSEEITSTDSLEIYFADGRELEIPAITSPTAVIEINFDGEIPEIISIVGLLVDRAGLVLINPSPDVEESVDGGIRGARVDVLFPAQILDGKFLTRKNFVTVRPTAIGATKMRLENGEWENFAEKEFAIALPDFGSQKIIFEFSNDSSAQKSAGVVVSRIPATADEDAQFAATRENKLGVFRAAATTRSAQLLVWGIARENAATLALANPAILPTAEIPTTAEIENLDAALELAGEIRELADEPKIAKILAKTKELAERNFSLDDFLSTDELANLFSKLDFADAEKLVEFLDLNSVAIAKSADAIAVGALSLGLRDSDDDGLADALELELGTNPFSKDSDADGNSDGAEFLEFGTNPLESDSPVAVGFSNLSEKIATPRPFLTGVSTANSEIEIVAKNSDGAEIAVGAAATDARGAFAILSAVALPAGNYELQIRENGEILAAENVVVDLDFILTPPKIFATDSEIFDESRAAFFGNTFFGARIVAFFDGNPAAVVADNSLGDFVVRPRGALALGAHQLIIFAELADGTRSPARVLNFSTVESEQKIISAEEIDFEKTALAAMVLILSGILGVGYFRRRRQN